MKGLSSKALQGLLGLVWEPGGLRLEASAVGQVAKHRVTDVGEMHPDLVSAAGFKPTFDQARNRLAVLADKRLQHLPVGDGFAAARTDGDAFAALGMAAER